MRTACASMQLPFLCPPIDEKDGLSGIYKAGKKVAPLPKK